VQVEIDVNFDMKDFLNLAGYFISEGCLAASRLTITQKMGLKALKMESDLQNIFKPFRMAHGYFQWQKRDKFLIKWLGENCGQKTRDKKIPREFLKLSKPQLKVLFDALILGDGWVCGKGLIYGTISERLADDVMELGLKLGYSVYKSKYKDIYKVSFRKNDINRRLIKKRIEEYNDFVYCFTVPTGVLVTRFNGRVSLQSNCKFLIEDLQVFHSGEITPCIDDRLMEHSSPIEGE